MRLNGERARSLVCALWEKKVKKASERKIRMALGKVAPRSDRISNFNRRLSNVGVGAAIRRLEDGAEEERSHGSRSVAGAEGNARHVLGMPSC